MNDGYTGCRSAYEAADVDGDLYVVDTHSAGKEGGDGSPEAPFRTVSAAASRAGPGDVVRVRSGVYRERVSPERGGTADAPVTYTAAPGERVVLSGAEPWTPDWSRTGEAYRAPLDDTLFRDSVYNPYATQARRLPEGRTVGQLFADGERLTEVASRASLQRSPGTWTAVDGGDALLVHPPDPTRTPAEHEFELTVRDRVFAPRERGLGHVRVRGFVVERAANQFPDGFWRPIEEDGWPQAGAVSCRSGHHWTIEHNLVRHAVSVGIDCGAEGPSDLDGDQPRPDEVGHHTIRRNVVAENGACGIAGWNTVGTDIVGNVVRGNDYRRWTAPENGGIKVHGFVDGRIEANLVRDNDCRGIWLDNVYRDARVTRNVVLDNQKCGIFLEMGTGPCLVDHNVVAFTRTGDGVYAHDASGLTLAHNLLFGNAHFGVYMRTVTDRTVSTGDGSEQVSTSHNGVCNNVFVDNYRGPVCLPLASDRDHDNRSDYNLFLEGAHNHWEGLGHHKLAVNTGGDSVDADAVADALATALDEAGVPDAERPTPATFREMPYLTLSWWRALTGNDEHSVAPPVEDRDFENGAMGPGAATFADGEPAVEFADTDIVTQLTCPPVEGCERDFFGEALGDRVYPGPFQSCADDRDRFVLWPLAEHTSR